MVIQLKYDYDENKLEFSEKIDVKFQDIKNHVNELLKNTPNEETVIILIDLDCFSSQNKNSELKSYKENFSKRLLDLFCPKKLDKSSGWKNIENKKGFFLFLINDDNGNKSKHYDITRLALLMRTLSSYEISSKVSYNIGSNQDLHYIKDVINRKLIGVNKKNKKESNFKKQLLQINKDIEILYSIWECEINGLCYKSDSAFIIKPGKRSIIYFVRDMAKMYTLGHGIPKECEEIVRSIRWMGPYGGAYDIDDKINSADLNDEEYRFLLNRRKAYEIMRDLGLWLAKGSFHWLRTYLVENKNQLTALIVDDCIASSILEKENIQGSNEYICNKKGSTERLINRLLKIQEKLNESIKSYTSDGFSFYYVCPTKKGNDWQKLIYKHLLYDPSQKSSESNSNEFYEIKDLQNNSIDKKINLEDYDFILVEVEYERERIGPKIVRQLSSYFDKLNTNKKRPIIIVLSRNSHIRYIHECLASGAEMYISKERIYKIPGRVTDARKGILLNHERQGQKSNFRSLYRLLPNQIAKLKSLHIDTVILGCVESIVDSNIKKIDYDAKDRAWLQQLPKADIHAHIGTCIDINVIEALAYNTCGYLISDNEDTKKDKGDDNSELMEIIKDTIIIAFLTGNFFLKIKNNNVHANGIAAKAFWWAAFCLFANKKTKHLLDKLDPDNIPNNAYEIVIEKLVKKFQKFETFEVCALIVASLSWIKNTSSDPMEQWKYVKDIETWSSTKKNITNGLEQEVDRIYTCFKKTSINWNRAYTSFAIQNNFPKNDDKTRESLHNCIKERVNNIINKFIKIKESCKLDEYLNTIKLKYIIDITENKISAEFKDFIKDININSSNDSNQNNLNFPSISDFIANPLPLNNNDHSLLRYLRGADLLGSEHLQYPENLILAAKSIVEQAVKDNIIYQELRCATLGYCSDGFNPTGATDCLLAAQGNRIKQQLEYSIISAYMHRHMRLRGVDS
jgi:hypothetical protein